MKLRLCRRHPWIVRVHEEMLKDGSCLTVQQIEERFGQSPITRANVRMSGAKKHGWFTGERNSKSTTELKFKAIDKLATIPEEDRIEVVSRLSFAHIGRGFPPVNSVFELHRWL